MEDELEQGQETPESVPAEQVADAEPQYVTKADLDAFAEKIRAETRVEAAEQGRRATQSWIDKNQARQKAAYQQADAMMGELKDNIADEDMPVIRDRLARKAMESLPAPEPEESSTIPEPLVEAIRAHGLDPADPELHPSRFQTPADFFAAVVKKGEAKRHNPNRNQEPVKPLQVDMGARGMSANLDTLRRRHKEAYETGDYEAARKIGERMDQLIGG